MRALRTRPGGGASTSGGLAGPTLAGGDADGGVAGLYLTQYRPLVRMAALLVGDVATAEEIVQDSFVAVHTAWPVLPDAGHALSYLHRLVVDRSRSALHQHVTVEALTLGLPGGEAAIEAERSAFIAALWSLPTRQREVVVLRYFADLPETQAALAIGISEAAVRVNAARAMSSLRAELRKAGERHSATDAGPGDRRTPGEGGSS